ncbi:hypothetical protein AAD001_02355 [Colwelliaceae bacterium 6471]
MMEYIQDAGFIFILVSTIALLTYLDKKFNLGLAESSGFTKNNTNAQLDDNEQTIVELKKRIQVLERIVTDPREQLKRDIESL